MRSHPIVRGALCAIVFVLLTSTAAHARQELLRWQAQPADPEPTTGYRVHYGPSPDNYTTTLDVGLPPQTGGIYSYNLTIPDLDTAFVAITAYNAAGPSDFSNEKVLAPPPNVPPNGVIDLPTGDVSILTGASVVFGGTGSDADGNLPLSYAWDFGAAGNSSAEDPALVAFNAPGTYVVTLTVTDALGLADPTPATVTVTVTDPAANQAPNGVINAPGAALSIETGETVSFAGTGTDPDANLPLSFNWSMNGATFATAEDPGAQAFNTAGTFVVTFTVTDALGLADASPASVTITVDEPANQAPNGVINAPGAALSIETGETVSFAGTGTDPDANLPLSFNWSMNGATFATAEDPGAQVFNTAGTFVVTFTVTDALGLADASPASVTITVDEPANQAPNGVINAPGAALSIETGETVSFAGTGTDPDANLPLSFNWSMNGATFATAEDPGAQAFNTAGTFVVTFTVTDALGLADPTPDNVILTVSEPAANQAPNGVISAPLVTQVIAAGDTVTFAAAGTDPDGNNPLSFAWDFGDGQTSSTESPGAIQFNTPGNFVVSFTVTDALGLADPTPASAIVAVSAPVFQDMTAAAGLVYLQYAGPPVPADGDAPYLTGGAAAGDYDGDGHTDLYVTRLDGSNILFRNRGNGTFADVTSQAGLRSTGAGNGAGWADLDNDGDLDLYVTCLGASETRFYLYINDGAGRFTEEAIARGAAVEGADPHYGFSVAFGDYDLDGWLDIHTTEWRPDSQNPSGAPSNARLLRNRGESAPGFFVDTTVSAGVALDGAVPATPGVSGTFSLSSRFADLDGDGWPELLVVGDHGTSRLFWNERDGTFRDGTAAAGVGTESNGTGSAIADANRDGQFDWLVSSVFEPLDPAMDGNRFYVNNGNGTFSDQTDVAGLRDGAYGAGVVVFDFDHDGDVDVAQTNGDAAPPSDPQVVLDPLRFWVRQSNTGTEAANLAGVDDTGQGRGVLTLDYDSDGDLDLFLVNNSGSGVLYRNEIGSLRNWLRVELEGTQSNRDGIGAIVSVTNNGVTQRRMIEAGGSFLGQSELAAHFGVGSSDTLVDLVTVEWPASGTVDTFTNVAANSNLLVVESATLSSAGAGATGSSIGSCGLLGIEPFLVLALAPRRWRRRWGRATAR